MDVMEHQTRVLDWYDRHGRKDLPWQLDKTPYRVWVSEIMLQQTQVATVIPYFQRFMERFPDAGSLAGAGSDTVLAHWAGLGYYARARNLHEAARQVMARHEGRFPDSLEALQALPGIGRSTAGAILSLAMNQPAAILDGNVKRVLARLAGIEGWPGAIAVLRELWVLSEALTPSERTGDYNQAMMDLGAMICLRGKPLCGACPLAPACVAHRTGRQRDYPSPRPRRDIPVRTCFMLIMENPAGQIYMERRPPVGIWGGLNSFPEFDTLEAARNWSVDRTIGCTELSALPMRRHTFSHFHLDYTPLHSRIQSSHAIHDQSDSLWVDPREASGMPAPIKALLAELVSLNAADGEKPVDGEN
jgi:A/G-specific adenine glycosylase